MPKFAVGLLLVAHLACGPQQRGWRAADRGGKTKTSVATYDFEAASEPVQQYNAQHPPPVPSSPLLDALVDVVARTAEANGKAAPAPDGRLFGVAAEVAGLVIDDRPPPYTAVQSALTHHGIIEPSPHLLVVRAEDGDVEGVTKELRARLAEILTAGRYARVGVGQTPVDEGGMITIVIAFQESFLVTEPIPRSVSHGGQVKIRGKLLHPYREPAMFVTVPGGEVVKVPVVKVAASGFRAVVACATTDGALQIEVVGYDRSGASVLANFPVWCGKKKPKARTVTESRSQESPVADASDAEKRIFNLLNESRKQFGLFALKWDEPLAAVGRAHSAEMFDKHFVAHVSPTTGSASDRVSAVGVVTPVVLENIARAYSPIEAHSGLMNSPGHRSNILSKEVSHIGVGVVLGHEVAGRPELYLTQVFIRVPAKVDPFKVREKGRRVIASRRRDAGKRPLARDADLDRIAQEYARSMAWGVERSRATATANRELDEMGARYSAVLTVIAVVGDAEDIRSDAVRDDKMSAMGIGVAQGKYNSGGDGALYVVMLFGRQR